MRPCSCYQAARTRLSLGEGADLRAESILSDARKLRDVANHLYLNAAEAGETPEYPDQIAITTTIMERIAAERRIDFPARFES